MLIYLDKETDNDIKALAVADFYNTPREEATKFDDVVSTNFKPPTKVSVSTQTKHGSLNKTN